MQLRNVLLAVAACSAVAFSQTYTGNIPVTGFGLDTPFQVSYAANPSAGESYINIINTGRRRQRAARSRIWNPVRKHLRERIRIRSGRAGNFLLLVPRSLRTRLSTWA